MIKRLKTIALMISLLLLIALTLVLWLHYSYTRFLSQTLSISQEQGIVIEAGSSAAKVADILVTEGIIDERYFMRYAFYRSGLSRRFMPGTFIIKPGMTAADLAEFFAGIGKYALKTLQVQAGMNLYELADRIEKSGLLDSKTFLDAAFDSELLQKHAIGAKGFEGYLSAGVYRFGQGAQGSDLIDAMHQRWQERWNVIKNDHRPAYEAYIKAAWTDHQIVTLASIVEKEAVVSKEKPVIARVFLNRLGLKMALQSDPTCVYPPKVLGEKPSPSRCKDKNSLYSTYVIAGLPPGPITMPSEASLRAVLMPYAGPDADALLFFVARQDGTWTHYFSKTYAEHKQAVDYYLKNNKRKKPSTTVQP